MDQYKLPKVPYQNEFDEVFRGDANIFVKMGAGAVCTGLVTVGVLLRSRRRGDPFANDDSTFAIAVVVAAVVGAVGGLALSLKDIVQKRIKKKKPVNPVLRLFFGMGIWSALLWMPAVIGITLAITMATLPGGGGQPKAPSNAELPPEFRPKPATDVNPAGPRMPGGPSSRFPSRVKHEPALPPEPLQPQQVKPPGT